MALELTERVETLRGRQLPASPTCPIWQRFRKVRSNGSSMKVSVKSSERFSPIKDYTGRLELHFLTNYTFEDHTEPNKPKTPEEAESSTQVSPRSCVFKCALVNREIGEIKEQEIYVGDIPMMTDRGTFIINGAEARHCFANRQKPGIYYKREVTPTVSVPFSATLIPNRGAWLEV